MNSSTDYLLVYGGLFVTVLLMGLGTYAIDRADQWFSRRRRIAGARTEDLKRVERELDDVRRELRKRHTPDA